MVPPTVQGLAVLLGQTSEETLHLTLETLLVVLSTAGEVLLRASPLRSLTAVVSFCVLCSVAKAVRPFVEGLTQQLIRVWGQCINDPLITAVRLSQCFSLPTHWVLTALFDLSGYSRLLARAGQDSRLCR